MTQLKITDIDTGEVSNNGSDDGIQVIALAHRARLAQVADPIRLVLAVADTVTGGAGPGATKRTRIARAAVDKNSDQGLLNKDSYVVSWSCRESRSNTDKALDAVERNSVSHLVVDKIDTLGTSHESIRARARRAVDAGAALHIADIGVTIDDESSSSVLGVLGALDSAGVALSREAEMRDVQAWCNGIDRDRGRAPLGFTYSDGEVVPGDDIDEVRAVLSMVRDDDPDSLSRRKAAERLDVAPRTIGRALDNADRYGLNEQDTEE